MDTKREPRSRAKSIGVLIVEDSRVIRDFLQHIIASDPRLHVVGAAETAEQAIGMLRTRRPNVISMDIRLPGMNGFEATRRIMSDHPTPIVVVAGGGGCDDVDIAIHALRAGALSVVEKPVGTTHDDYEALAQRLCTQLAIMSQVKVVRQRFNGHSERTRNSWRGSPRQLHRISPLHEYRMVGIVASTGGPHALQKVLGALPTDFPVPIAVVQHITASFFAGFAEWLDRVCPLPVRVASYGLAAEPGVVYLAPPDFHLQVAGTGFRLNHGQPVCAERPSGDILFQSMAHSLGAAALGVLLTGMGRDGAEGLAAIRAAGGHTIAEDESTAVVYGMPGAAVEINAAWESLPLDDIADRLRSLMRATREVRV